jgi:hypothetical protein
MWQLQSSERGLQQGYFSVETTKVTKERQQRLHIDVIELFV